MVQTKARYFLILTLILISSSIHARPVKGFHKGPYMLLSGGAMEFTEDNNARTGTKVGNDLEPTIGLHFGWYVTDWLAPELQMRYSTNKTTGIQEHIAAVNLNLIYSFVTDQLTDLGDLSIFPSLFIGPMFLIAAVPGDPSSGDNMLAMWGPGFSVGGGLHIIYKKYLYAGVRCISDFISYDDKFQNINGASTKVIDGGWDVQLGVMGLVGVHF